MIPPTEAGRRGEAMAYRFLKKKGYRIIRQNWRYRQKEIDMIAREGEDIVIIEVKLRSTDYFGDPSEAVTRKKQNYLIEAAGAFLDTIEDEEPNVRFDIISIIDTLPEAQIELITDAFSPGS